MKCTKVSTKDMTREEWLRLRQTGIGGSDSGAIMQVNPWSSQMKVFKDKTSDEVEEINNEATRVGTDLENYVAERFTEATGLAVRKSNYMYRSVEHPFMIADVDRLIVGEDAGLECKTANAYNADKWKYDIPEHYKMQCYHYMAVTGKKSWYIACVILGVGFVYYKLEWNDEIISHLISKEKKFWENHIMTGVMPDPDGSKVSDEVISKYFGKANEDGSTIELTDFEDRLERRSEMLEQINKLNDEVNKIDQEVKIAMKDNAYAVCGRHKVSWTNVESKRLDSKLIKEDGLYDKYAKVTSSRRFHIKAA